MNINQEDKFSMYYVVKNTCEKYQTTWTTNAVFAATYNLWVAKIPLIEQNRDAQTLETTGITTDKTAKRNSMTEKTLFMINRLQSYANVVNNPELLESIKYSASDLKKSRDTDVIGICNNVLAKASANAAAIATYGVTAAMITELQTAITAYSATLAKPKAAKSQTKTATENLTKLFKEADELLVKRMDLDIELFKTSKPDFYSQYKTARIIIPTGGGATSVLGSVSLAGSGEPLKGVSFTFVAENNGMMKAASTETVKPIVKKSADKGKFRASLPENTYRVIIEKIGFKSQEVTITVANGESTNLNIELEKN
ncbi:MAG: carboxypeptidase-like regulatory domain-containing protein [Paludibacter sp.]|nr:carboxypeptidase-like regulatory domain-containing protein [Paludibacter sp.]MDD4429451.1 carboxypeptidase-like regulatory domain-containing protein [Paludibacter sp.]